MNRKLIAYLFICFAMVIVFNACVKDKEIIWNSNPDLQIQLRWNKAYDLETKEKVEVGLQWSLSFLGATLPTNKYSHALIWQADNKIQLNITELGFSLPTQNALAQLIKAIKQSEEYSLYQSVDIGRWIMLTLNSSNHYYKITGALNNYTQFKEQFLFSDSLGAIVESAVSKGERKIYLSNTNQANQMAFIAAEGQGSLPNHTFTEDKHEVLNIMDNGQLRFAIYDNAGQLIPTSDSMYTFAGKPAKCLWCHEIVIQEPFSAVTDVDGYRTIENFKSFISSKMNLLQSYRNTLQSVVNFNHRQDHTFAELLYISFMETSAERLAQEWNMSVAKVRQRLVGIPTHRHIEFDFLGDLYNRKDIDELGPYGYIKVPDSAREKSVYEPDLIK
ncbi:MAG: hypothetical protein V4620_10570 [Bacteroidota bacterium]